MTKGTVDFFFFLQFWERAQKNIKCLVYWLADLSMRRRDGLRISNSLHTAHRECTPNKHVSQLEKHGVLYVAVLLFLLYVPDCWLEVSIGKVLRPVTSTQVFLGFPVRKSKC